MRRHGSTLLCIVSVKDKLSILLRLQIRLLSPLLIHLAKMVKAIVLLIDVLHIAGEEDEEREAGDDIDNR